MVKRRKKATPVWRIRKCRNTKSLYRLMGPRGDEEIKVAIGSGKANMKMIADALNELGLTI